MFAISPQLTKVFLAYLFLMPWFVLYQKKLFPYFAQTGFDGQIIILAEIIFIVFIAIFGRHPQVTKQGSFLIGAIIIWQISGFLSASFSEHFHASLIKQIELMIHCMFAYCVWVFLGQTQKQEKMVWFLIFTFVWIVYYIYAAWHISPNPFLVDWVHATPFFNNIRHSGFVFIAYLPLLILPLLSEFRNKKLITAFLLSIYWGIVIWSCSRGTYFASIISVILIYFTYKKVPKLGFIIIVSFLIGWILALLFPSIEENLQTYRLWFIEYKYNEFSVKDRVTSGRWDMWANSLSHAFQHNFLFGQGADNYIFIAPNSKDFVHPHSSAIQMASDFGILGLICLTTIFLSLINTWRTQQNNKITCLSIVAVLSFLIASLVDGHLYYNFSLVYFCILIALSISPSQYKNLPSKRNFMPFLILIAIAVFIIPIKKHWQTYIEQQFPLIEPAQFKAVSEFPSYYLPLQWLYSDQSNPDLRSQAIALGQKNGPKRCNFYLMEFLEADTPNETQINGVLTHCSKFDVEGIEGEKIFEIKQELESK